jgi:AsmA-like protein
VLESVDLPVQIAGPTVTLQPFALRLAGGTVRGGAILTWRGGVPGIRLADVRVQGVAAAPVLVDFLCQPYAVAGRLDASGEGAFAGTGPDLLRSARGTWQVQVGPGRLVGPAVLSLLSGAVRVGTAVYSVVNLDTPASLFASPLEFDSLSAAGGVGGGQLRVRHLAMQGRQLRVTGRGTYGLVDTRLDFDLEVRTGRTAFGVKLGGTSGEPSYNATGRGLLRSLTDALGTPRPSAGKSATPGGVESGGR